MPDPTFLIGAVMAMALTAYALLGGADYGGGVWDLLATGSTAEQQRATISRAIAPVWEANHVWLILVVTVLFTAFPPAFAWMGTYLHIPLMLALVGIVLRGSAFMFRAYAPGKERRRWRWIFDGASTGTPLLLGMIVGAVTEGRIDTAARSGFRALFVDPWLTPFALSVGAFTLVLFAYLAAVYLTLEAREAKVADAFRARALASGVLAAVMALLVFGLAGRVQDLRAGLTSSAWALPLHVATGLAATGAFVSLWIRRFWWARTATIAQVALIILGWALAQYPYLVRPHLTFQATAAPRATLVLLLQTLAVGAVILAPALLYLFRIFGPPEKRHQRRR